MQHTSHDADFDTSVVNELKVLYNIVVRPDCDASKMLVVLQLMNGRL